MGQCFQRPIGLIYFNCNEVVIQDEVNLTIGQLSHNNDEFIVGKFYKKFLIILITHDVNHVNNWVMSTQVQRSQKDTVSIFNSESLKRRNKLFGHKGGVNCVQYFKKQNKIVTAGNDKNIMIWDSKDCKCIDGIENAHNLTITSLGLSKNEKYLLSGSTDCFVKMWNLEKLELEKIIDKCDYPITFVTFSPSDNFIVSCQTDQLTTIWKTETFKPQKKLTKINNPFMSDLVCFNNYESLLCIAGPNKDLSFVQLNSDFRELPPIRDAHNSYVSSVIFSQDGYQLISGDQMGQIKIWNIDGFQCMQLLEQHTGRINSLILIYPKQKLKHRDQVLLISGSGDYQIIRWMLEFHTNN